jgi:hypothetical protein
VMALILFQLMKSPSTGKCNHQVRYMCGLYMCVYIQPHNIYTHNISIHTQADIELSHILNDNLENKQLGHCCLQPNAEDRSILLHR